MVGGEGGVKVEGRGPDQPTSEIYNLKLFVLQIRLLLDPSHSPNPPTTPSQIKIRRKLISFLFKIVSKTNLKLGEKSIYVQFRMPPDVRMHLRPTKIDWLLGGLRPPQPVGPPMTETMNFKSSGPTFPKFLDPPLVLVDVLVNVY